MMNSKNLFSSKVLNECNKRTVYNFQLIAFIYSSINNIDESKLIFHFKVVYIIQNFYTFYSEDMKTYFITGRKCTSVYHLKVEANISQHNTGNDQPYLNNKQVPEQNNHLNSINNNSTKDKVKLCESQPNGTKSLPVLGKT